MSENGRVLECVTALEAQDLEAAGALLADSHASLRDDYEVSCEELDRLVLLAGRSESCFGARMTGGGFGGCTVNLVARGTAVAFGQAVVSAYGGDGSGRVARFWRTGAGAGARLLSS